jgi:hypothetical protein
MCGLAWDRPDLPGARPEEPRASRKGSCRPGAVAPGGPAAGSADRTSGVAAPVVGPARAGASASSSDPYSCRIGGGRARRGGRSEVVARRRQPGHDHSLAGTVRGATERQYPRVRWTRGDQRMEDGVGEGRRPANCGSNWRSRTLACGAPVRGSGQAGSCQGIAGAALCGPP